MLLLPHLKEKKKRRKMKSKIAWEKKGLISILCPSPVSFWMWMTSLAQCSGEKGGNEVHILGWSLSQYK